MYLDLEKLRESILLTAENNGDAYRDDMNAKRAVSEAITEHLKAARIAMYDMARFIEDDLAREWGQPAKEEAERAFFTDAMNRIKNGETVEVTEGIYDDMLGSVPPLMYKPNGFIMGECYSGNQYFEFFQKAGKYFGRLTRVNETV